MGEEGESTDVLAGADPQLRAAVEEASGLLHGCCCMAAVRVFCTGCCVPRSSRVVAAWRMHASGGARMQEGFKFNANGTNSGSHRVLPPGRWIAVCQQPLLGPARCPPLLILD